MELEQFPQFARKQPLAKLLKDRAVSFLNGRYTLQVRHQTEPSIYSY